jgi:phosphoglycerate dehydrogenase-like enzyme
VATSALAGLDVFEKEPLPDSSPLWDMENVIVSPHSAGLSKYLNDRLANLFVENLHNLRDGRPLVGEIDVRVSA